MLTDINNHTLQSNNNKSNITNAVDITTMYDDGISIYSYMAAYPLSDSTLLNQINIKITNCTGVGVGTGCSDISDSSNVAGGTNASSSTNGSSSANDSATSLQYHFLFNDSLRDLQLLAHSYNGTIAPHREEEEAYVISTMVQMIALTVVLGLMILVTIIGNVFVIAAIILERNLQNVANYLVASLAVADLFVACLVMPLGAVYEISQGWILGPELCDIWTSCDVLCCTASILHLVAIAADRYWTVTNIDYNNLRTPRRVFFMIFCVWAAAVVVSLAPQFGWKDPEYLERIEQQQCMVSQDVAYQIFATCCTFYVPLLIILALYWKIYKIARKRIQRHAKRHLPVAAGAMVAARAGRNQNDFAVVSSESEQHRRRRMKICFGRTSDGGGGGVGASVGRTAATGGSNLEVYPRDSISVSHTREETEFSTSNFDSKSHAGTEVTTMSMSVSDVDGDVDVDPDANADSDELRSPTALDISTVSLQVAKAIHSQHVATVALTADAAQLTARQPIGSGCQVSPTQTLAPPHHHHHHHHQQRQHHQSQQQQQQQQHIANPHHKLAKRRQLLEAKRERKAAQTLAIITGAFAVCWLPFFVMALHMSLCKECKVNAAVASLFLWLGYFNSTLNPIIYTIFNPEFRRAFQRILFGRKRFPLHHRSGKI